MWALLLCWCGEADRSSSYCCGKPSSFLTDLATLGPVGKHRDWSGDKWKEGAQVREPYCGLCRGPWVSRSGLATLDSFDRLWAMGLVPGPGTGQGRECEMLRKELLRLDSGWLGLYLRSTLHSELLTVSRMWLTLGGQFLQGQQGPSCQNIWNTITHAHFNSCPCLYPVPTSSPTAQPPTPPGHLALPTSSHHQTWIHLSQQRAQVSAHFVHRNRGRESSYPMMGGGGEGGTWRGET